MTSDNEELIGLIRKNKNKQIISHDYNSGNLRGIKKTFREFFNDSPKKIIEMANTHSMVIK